ncbi:MAG: non-canonical purine NTP pyrophosphatase, partial [Thermotogaceae bacterium]|nr:non-canonical purine NTP pyrophosphatase [Thermotogaceae bacterium]
MMLVVASRNENKLREIQKLAPDGFNLVSLRKLSITVDAPEEGDSFIQNAISKAIFYGNLLMKPVVADDSGL